MTDYLKSDKQSPDLSIMSTRRQLKIIAPFRACILTEKACDNVILDFCLEEIISSGILASVKGFTVPNI